MLETRIVHTSGVVAVPLVVSITVEMAKSFTLGMVKAILSGKGEVIDLARTNLRRHWEIRVGGALLLLSRPQLLFGQLTGEPLVETPNDIVRIVTLSKCTPRGFL
jgi:hypothetical protein